uniref:Asialoglycoprotein receptor 2-like n=1 Tax=Xiphophorus maculatus TaxID=8083 RepID=A0A3B5QN59_XIPMA
MTTEYHDEVEDDSSSFWNKEPRPISFSAVSRVRRWLYPGLAAAFVLIFIVAVGITNSSTLSRLWSVEKALSNQTEWLMSAQRLAAGNAAKDAQRLKFSVESNKEQLTSGSGSVLSVPGSGSVTVLCVPGSGSVSDGCCPLGWETFGSSCYLFSRSVLSWHEARDWCNGHESHLVILMSDEEWDFVTRFSAGSFYWVGLTDEKSGRWEWVNQTPYVMNRRRWKPGQPDSWTGHGMGPGDEDCAHIHNDGRLNDLHYTASAAEPPPAAPCWPGAERAQRWSCWS